MISLSELILLEFGGGSFFSTKAKRWIDGRKGLKQQISSIEFSKNKWVWFHCSSFGEYQDGKNLMELFKERYPRLKILLTFFSPSGFEMLKGASIADFVCYLPLDTRIDSAYFIDKVNPVAVFFVRNDIWPNYIAECSSRQIPLFLVSFTINSKSKFLKPVVRNFFRNSFKRFDHIFVHDSMAANILASVKFSDNVVVAGNSRIDRAISVSKKGFRSEGIEKFISDSFCVVAGSTHCRDKEIFLETFESGLCGNIKWIIVPHEVDVVEIDKARKMFGSKMICYSQIESCVGSENLLWVDRIGILAKIYRYANIAFIGGGFKSAGVHSILEPAAYGCPVAFGPNYRNYTEAKEMMKFGGARIIRNAEDLEAFILAFAHDTRLLEKTRRLNQDYMIQHSGATERMFDLIKSKKCISQVF